MTHAVPSSSLCRRLEAVRGAVQGGNLSGLRTGFGVHPDGHQKSDPRWLAERVLASCRVDLDLPDLRIEWTDDLESWGECDGKRATVLRLSTTLLEPDHHAKVPTVVAHEARHAWAFLGVRMGMLPIKALLDDEQNERDAADYGHQVAERWRHLT